jgi:Xaa-Pro aminopeptidase
MEEIKNRVAELQLLLDKSGLDAWYISGTDPHSSEYLPARWRTREFISGFTGSYGDVVITRDEAVLWTDTRYFLQAEAQLSGSGFTMQKLRVPGAVPSWEWLANNLKPGSKVGFFAESLPVASFRLFDTALGKKEISLVFTDDWFEKIWVDRPPLPVNPVFDFDVKYCGISRQEKFGKIAEKLAESGAGLQVITALDDLAWTFNLRGSDINYNPVFIGYGIIRAGEKGGGKGILFADPDKFPAGLRSRLKDENVEFFGYEDFQPYLKNISGEKILIDPASTNYAVYAAISGKNEIVEAASIPALLKAVKNPVELDGFREAMRKDGLAMVEFLYWLKNTIGKELIKEYFVGRKLAEFRAKQAGFMGESFDPIVGYKAHGAIVHLSVGEEDSFEIEKDGLLLFDSGGQYLEGTTDITRTIALGNLSETQKRDFTLVLKGMVALSQAVFPFGTKGCHLDILARKALWENGLNYGHGTGHGVGHFLSVHEGPMSIRQEYNPVNIEPGMVLSDEPGLYREGLYGIRTENMIVCVEKETTAFGHFLGFETLTLCPIDTSAIDFSILDKKEIEWLNQYHQKVLEELSPCLDGELKEFLKEQTKVIG